MKLSSSDDSVEMLAEPGPVETRYAVIMPHDGIRADYLHAVVGMVYPAFFRQFNQGINMAFTDLLRLEVPIHDDEKVRKSVCDACHAVNAQIEATKKEIATIKAIQAYLLRNMFVGGE